MLLFLILSVMTIWRNSHGMTKDCNSCGSICMSMCDKRFLFTSCCSATSEIISQESIRGGNGQGGNSVFSNVKVVRTSKNVNRDFGNSVTITNNGDRRGTQVFFSGRPGTSVSISGPGGTKFMNFGDHFNDMVNFNW